MQTEKYKNLINNTLGDPVRAARFAANITSAVAVNPTLQECDAGTILAGALLGESLLLQPSPQLGQFYLVPFKSKAKRDRQGNVIEPACLKAQFVLGYKGYIQLALRTGQYKRLNVLEIKSGELGGWNPFEERFHEMHFIEDFEKRAAMPTVGYGIVWAFAPEYEHLMLALGGFEWINNIDKCNGVLLNRIGQLVCLTRQQAGAMIGSRELADNDDIYRVCLKYKAYVNSCRCTPNDIIEATKIIFGATEVVYSERRDVPATIYLSISAPFSDLVLSILGTHDLVVHPAGVRVRINCSTEDAETFGFVDLNPRVAGFGEGMFAQSIN